MELSNEFEVGVPIDKAWALLTDLEQIAPCLPGAQLQEIEGDEYRGIVKVKVGPITAQYKGAAHFVEKDTENHKAVLSASGRDTRGQGNASATITADLTAKGDVTHVLVVTDLTITGKVAQFGRGVMGDVSSKLLGQFVQNLETMVMADTGKTEAEAAPSAGATSSNGAGTDTAEGAEGTEKAASETAEPVAAAPSSGVRRIDAPEAEPIDLMSMGGSPVFKRLIPLVGVGAVLLIIIALLRRRSQ